MDFERIDTEEIWQGHVGGVRVDTFRYADGGEAKREVFTHPGAVSILPFDGERIWLVRQPREPVGEPELLELPAGKIDKPGEELGELALRELQEEIGKGARSVRHLCTFYNSPGPADRGAPPVPGHRPVRLQPVTPARTSGSRSRRWRWPTWTRSSRRSRTRRR